MTYLLRFVGILALCATVSRAEQPAQLTLGPASEQFLKLRLAYLESFSLGWVDAPDRKALIKLYDSDKGAFITKSAEWLRHCPVDAKMHLMRASALSAATHAADQLYHRLMFYGLMGSIASSGDGTAAKTAYKVISVDEEYTFLNYIGAETKGQSLRDGCDVLEVEVERKPRTIYFDISDSLAASQKRIDQKQPK